MKSRHAVVTGVSSGIGAACADLLLRQGYQVTGVDVRGPTDFRGRFVQADLSDAASVAAAVSAIEGPIDVLCNVAGLPGSQPSQQILAVNVLGLRTLTQGLLDRMARGSVVVNLASLAGSGWRDRLSEIHDLLATSDWAEARAWIANHPRAPDDAYRFSKECVIVATAQWAAKHVEREVRFVSVSPGPVATPILEDFRRSMAPGQVDAAIGAVGRAATALDIAQAVLLLAGDQAGWINGIDLPVDGGLSAVRRYGPVR